MSKKNGILNPDGSLTKAGIKAARRWPQLSGKSLWQQAREDRANAIDETRRGIRR